MTRVRNLADLLDSSGDVKLAHLDNTTSVTVTDNLTSTSTTEALSAKQGKTLKTLADGKQASDADLTTLATNGIGTSANQLVQLNGSAELPAVSGANLTNLPAGGATNINGLSDGTTSISGNIGLGAGAVDSITTGDYNVGVGEGALTANTTGNHNVAVGYGALNSTSTKSQNTAVGYFALNAMSGNDTNTAMGYWTAGALTSGFGVTAVGRTTLANLTTGSRMTAFGTTAGAASTTASNATYLGYYAGYNITTGNNNICIGYTSGQSSSPSGTITTGSNTICLGDNSISNFYCADTSISSSDRRDKADIEDFNTGLDFVNKMRPVTYRWDKRSWYLDDEDTDVLSVTRDGSLKKQKQHIGFIAQEVEELEQEIGFSTSKDNQLMCNTNEDDTAMGIKYERIVPVLVNAIKELSANNTALLARIEALENE